MRAHFGNLTAIALAICLSQSVALAAARETLIPLEQCPAVVDPLGGCVLRALSLSSSKLQKIIRRQVGQHTISKLYLIRGRLNGGEEKPYALKFTQSRDDYFADTDHSGPVALPANISNGRLIILTERGELEVLSNGLRREPLPNVIIIDKRRWKVLARYYHDDSECLDLSFLTKPSLTEIWDEAGLRCVSVNSKGAGITSTRLGTCKRPVKGKCKIPKQFIPASIPLDRLNATARDLKILGLWSNNPDNTEFGGSGWDVRSYEVSGTNFFVIQGHCSDCDS